MRKLIDKDIKIIFSIIEKNMQENKELLFQLDSALGDGDLGVSMSNGFSKVAEELNNYNEKKIGKIFIKAGFVLAETIPSTMGTLLADAFIKAGQAIQEKTEINLEDLFLFFSEFLKRIIATGKADYGEKTMIDSLYPATKSLEASLKSNLNYRESFKAAYNEAKKGSQATKEMVALHGRAKWFKEKSIGKEDPGAVASMIFIKSFYEYFETIYEN